MEVYFCGKLGEEIPDYVHGFAFRFTKNTEKKKKRHREVKEVKVMSAVLMSQTRTNR